MEYEILYENDNGTAKVRMTLGSKTLEQDFDIEDIDTNVKQGMAVFQSEIDRKPDLPILDEALIGEIVEVKDLPAIQEADLLPADALEN